MINLVYYILYALFLPGALALRSAGALRPRKIFRQSCELDMMASENPISPAKVRGNPDAISQRILLTGNIEITQETLDQFLPIITGNALGAQVAGQLIREMQEALRYNGLIAVEGLRILSMNRWVGREKSGWIGLLIMTDPSQIRKKDFNFLRDIIRGYFEQEGGEISLGPPSANAFERIDPALITHHHPFANNRDPVQIKPNPQNGITHLIEEYYAAEST